jgi:tetratricopeptide (TPR) repeat protein
MRPEDRGMLYLYTEYLRAMGRDKEVEDILTSTNENGLLWNHYYQRGQYEEAKGILLKLYEKEPNNVGVLKGLLLVAEKMTDPNAAAKYSEDLIGADPAVESYLIQIQSFLRVGLIKEAGLKLQSFTEKYPDEPRTMLLRAWLLMRRGQLEEALELTNRYLEGNSDSAAGWRLRGEVRFYEGDMTMAINDLKQSKSLSDEAITRVVLAKAYLRIARYEDAVTELKNAIDMPGVPLDARLLLEDTYMRLDRKDALKEFYNDVLSESRNNVFWLNRAASFAMESGEYNGAVQLYGKSFQIKRQEYSGKDAKDLRFDALYASAFDGYLRSLIMQAGVPNTSGWNPKQLDEVFDLAKDYIETDYAPLAYLRMAQAKLLLGHKKTATDYCQKAVDEAESNETLASEVLLRMFLLLGPDEVSKYCTEKLKSNPDSLPANFTMFNLAKVNREYNKAVAYIDKCIQLTEADSPRRIDYMAKKAEILTLAYQGSSDNKYLGMAIADYESLLAKMPNNTSVLNNLAYMLALSNERLPDALKYAETVYSLMPNDPGVLDTYGYVLHKNGRHPEAAERLAAAVQQYEQNKVDAPPDVYEHLGMVKEALGDKVAALTEYSRALEIGASRLTDKDKERINKAIERVSR